MPALPLVPGVGSAAAAAVLALAVDLVYLLIIASQGDGVGSRVGLVAGSLAAAAAAALASETLAPAPRAALLGWATATFWFWTVLGLASIGVLLAPSAGLALYALSRTPGGRLPALAGAALAFLVALTGLVWT